MGNRIWVESMWLTHRESITVGEPSSGESVTRDLSIGMTVKSDGAKSDVLYKALREAINRIVEEEKENWLDTKLMHKEKETFKEVVKSATEEVGTGEVGNGSQQEVK